MSFATLAAVLIATQPNPAAHFCEFKKQLDSSIYLDLIALDQAALVAQKSKTAYFDPLQGKTLDQLSPQERALAIQMTIVKIDEYMSRIKKEHRPQVIVDVGDLFSAQLLQELQQTRPYIVRHVYYDQMENYVPGNYSQTAAKILPLAQSILVANSTLVQYPFYVEPDVAIETQYANVYPIGYYPLEDALKLKQMRTKRARPDLLNKLNVADTGQKILVYAGGASEEYHQLAFPAFLRMLDKLTGSKNISQWCIVLQQHPQSKSQNLDGKKLLSWKKSASSQAPQVFISPADFHNTFAGADAALYYQTSANIQFLLAGIPTFQVGHKIFEDQAVRMNLVPSITHEIALYNYIEALSSYFNHYEQSELYNKLGIAPNWPQNLIFALQQQ